MTEVYFPWNDGDWKRARQEALDFIQELKVDEAYLVDVYFSEDAYKSRYVVSWKGR